MTLNKLIGRFFQKIGSTYRSNRALILAAACLIFCIALVSAASAGTTSPTGDVTWSANGTTSPSGSENGSWTTDSDGDGLSDAREQMLGTNPEDPDSDSDGLNDSQELALNTDPLDSDTDGDGIPDKNEIEIGTDPALRDTDNDGLADDNERSNNTDPTVRDTDGDGLLDGVEVKSKYLSDANPTRFDVFIEIDYVPGSRLSQSEQSQLIEVFASAPVSNPDGSEGISLHLMIDSEVPPEDPFTYDDLESYHKKYENAQCGGFHYAVLTEEAVLEEEGDVGGFANIPKKLFTAAPAPSVIMHELGHVRGIGSQTAPGVDSYEVGFDEYPSTMNYNAPDDYVHYSIGTNGSQDNDDWATFAGGSPHLDTEPYTYDLYPKPRTNCTVSP